MLKHMQRAMQWWRGRKLALGGTDFLEKSRSDTDRHLREVGLEERGPLRRDDDGCDKDQRWWDRQEQYQEGVSCRCPHYFFSPSIH